MTLHSDALQPVRLMPSPPQQVAEEFLRDRATKDGHTHGIRKASADGDLHAIAANLDAGHVVDGPFGDDPR